MDHRPIVGAEYTRAKAIESVRVTVFGDAGARVTVRQKTLATRGEKLVLLGRDWFDRDDPEGLGIASTLHMSEFDDDGLRTREAMFAQTQLNEAIECLEDWAEELHPELRPVSPVTRALRRATIAFDRDALAKTLADDLICIDHQLASFPELDKLGMIERVAALWEQLPDGLEMINPACPAFNELGMVVIVNASAIGGLGTWSYAMMMIVDREVISRIEIFPTDQLDRALARFDELTAEVP